MHVQRIEVKRIPPQNVPTIHVRTRRPGLHWRLVGMAYRAIRDLLPRCAVLTLE
jgi:hypothetical protein